MSKLTQTHDDEIYLFDIIKIIWDGKWFITAFAAIAVLVGSLFLVKDTKYESKIFFC